MFSQEQLDQSMIIRFDYIVRKVTKISTKEATDNFNEQTVDMIWFYTLDSIFKIKNEHLAMLEAVKEEQIKSARATGLLLSEHQSQLEVQAVKEKYDQYILNLQQFFKSRIAYTIENTLKHIEFEDFLDHIVKNNNRIQFKELQDMINAIFSETTLEFSMLKHAKHCANQFTVSTFENEGKYSSRGILFRNKQCKSCNKLLDDFTE